MGLGALGSLVGVGWKPLDLSLGQASWGLTSKGGGLTGPSQGPGGLA